MSSWDFPRKTYGCKTGKKVVFCAANVAENVLQTYPLTHPLTQLRTLKPQEAPGREFACPAFSLYLHLGNALYAFRRASEGSALPIHSNTTEKNMIKKMLVLILVLGTLVITTTGCSEARVAEAQAEQARYEAEQAAANAAAASAQASADIARSNSEAQIAMYATQAEQAKLQAEQVKAQSEATIAQANALQESALAQAESARLQVEAYNQAIETQAAALKMQALTNLATQVLATGSLVLVALAIFWLLSRRHPVQVQRMHGDHLGPAYHPGVVVLPYVPEVDTWPYSQSARRCQLPVGLDWEPVKEK